jgi:membrane-associated protein
MDTLHYLFDLILHLERHLDQLIHDFGGWIYVLMFLVVFCETGLVVTPFLPGDSLLFALGTFAARPDGLNAGLLIVLLTAAAILGDAVNYRCGMVLGPRIFRGEKVRFLNRKHLDKTREFFERYGGKTIVLARFMPIIRTFAPFVAGMGQMTYRRFMVYNVVGGFAWVVIFIGLGYWFGNQPFVKKNFTYVILAIILLSVLPGVIEFYRERRRQPPPPQPAAEPKQ